MVSIHQIAGVIKNDVSYTIVCISKGAEFQVSDAGLSWCLIFIFQTHKNQMNTTRRFLQPAVQSGGRYGAHVLNKCTVVQLDEFSRANVESQI